MENIFHELLLKPGYLKDQYLDHYYFRLFIFDLSDDLKTNIKLLLDDISLFSVVHNMNTSTVNLNNDLSKIRNWAIQRKIKF